MAVSKILLFFIYAVFYLVTVDLYACTTIIVGKSASLTGKTMIARTSDTIDARRGKNFQIYHDVNGEKSYIGLPYHDLEADPAFDMAQVITNRYGVSVSATETIQSSPQSLRLDAPTWNKLGVSEPSIPSIVMPDAKSAREAVRILGRAIEQYGVYGNKGFGVLIADSEGAWYLETLSGHQWVAIQIPEQVYFVAANGPGQIQEYLPNQYVYEMSHYQGMTPITFAVKKGVAVETEGTFNFRSTYADVGNADNRAVNYIRLAYLQHYFNPSTFSFDDAVLDKGEYPMFLKPEHLISVADLKTVQASHYEDFSVYDPYTRFNKNEKERPFYYPIANLRTSNGHVTVIDNGFNEGDHNITNVEYIALGMPTVSFYVPIYYGVTTIPIGLTGASNKADNRTLFWEFRKLQTLVFLSDPEQGIEFDLKHRLQGIKESYLALTTEIEADQRILEKQYVMTHDTKLIDEFTQNTLVKISVLNQKMISDLMRELDINARYHLDTEEARNVWFTHVIRIQDCNYRRDHCQPTTPDRSVNQNLSRYVDEPVL